MLRFRDLLRDGLTYPMACGIFADYCEDRGTPHAADFWRIRQMMTTPRGDEPWVVGATAVVQGNQVAYVTYPNGWVNIQINTGEVLWEEAVPQIALYDGQAVVTREHLVRINGNPGGILGTGDLFVPHCWPLHGLYSSLYIQEETLQPVGSPKGILQAYILDEMFREYVVLTTQGEVVHHCGPNRRILARGVSYVRVNRDWSLRIHRGVDLTGKRLTRKSSGLNDGWYTR
jgi:hypothetical protein